MDQSRRHPEVRTAIHVWCRLAAVLIARILNRRVIKAVVLQGRKLTFGRGADSDTLLGEWSMPHVLEHHLPADNKFHRRLQIARCGGSEQAMRPREQLSPETGAQEARDDSNVLVGHS